MNSLFHSTKEDGLAVVMVEEVVCCYPYSITSHSIRSPFTVGQKVSREGNSRPIYGESRRD